MRAVTRAMTRAAILCSLPALACAAETSVAPPSIGVVRDCEGRARRVFGAPGAFLLGPAESLTHAGAPPPEDAKIEDAKIEGRTLILRKADGSEKRVQLPETAAGLQRMGSGWLAAPPFAIKLTADGAIVYRLPMKACGGRSAEAGR